jgi:hypothetical protein
LLASSSPLLLLLFASESLLTRALFDVSAVAVDLCRWLNKERIARKLSVGFESFKVINQPKTDVNLRFSTINMQRMAALLDPAEQDDFLLIWRPKGNSSTYAAPVSTPRALTEIKGSPKGLPESPVKHKLIRVSYSGIERSTSNGSEQSSLSISDTETVSDTDSGSVASVSTAVVDVYRKPGAVLTPELEAEVRRMRTVPVGEWRSFHINLGAFLYCTLFQMPVPPQSARMTKPEVLRWLKIKPEDAVIEHTFKVYK